MLDNEQGGTVGRRPITATDREWGQQCQDCQPHRWGEGEIRQTATGVIATAERRSIYGNETTGERTGWTDKSGGCTNRWNSLELSNQLHRLREQESKTKPQTTGILPTTGTSGWDHTNVLEGHIQKKREQVQWIQEHGGAILRGLIYEIDHLNNWKEQARRRRQCLDSLIRGH